MPRVTPLRPGTATAVLLLVIATLSLAVESPGSTRSTVSEVAIAPTAAVAAAGSTGCPPAAHCAPSGSQNSFYDFFNYVHSIPDTVLNRGDAATATWIRAHPRPGTARGNGPNQSMFMGRMSVANPYRCTLAVAALLVTTGLPALKLLKIKKAIEALGGVGQAVRLVVGATSAAEKGTAILNALKDLVAELLGIAAVEQYCFG